MSYGNANHDKLLIVSSALNILDPYIIKHLYITPLYNKTCNAFGYSQVINNLKEVS